ncbi:MAG: MarR family transcriptional regulator [Phycisphaerales bacterium]|nr:MAG: MarR family transcriptional regulator [Phycisphaerales bacterium]
MTVRDDVKRLMDLYPRIFFACHTRHVKDPRTRQVLSAHQASILDHLDDVEPTGVGELAAHMGVTASTTSLALDRLVRQGYVARVRDPADRRRVHVVLTEAGVRIKQASTVLDPRRIEALLRRLTPGDRRRGLEGLALLARAASEGRRTVRDER